MMPITSSGTMEMEWDKERKYGFSYLFFPFKMFSMFPTENESESMFPVSFWDVFNAMFGFIGYFLRAKVRVRLDSQGARGSSIKRGQWNGHTPDRAR